MRLAAERNGIAIVYELMLIAALLYVLIVANLAAAVADGQ